MKTFEEMQTEIDSQGVQIETLFKESRQIQEQINALEFILWWCIGANLAALNAVAAMYILGKM